MHVAQLLLSPLTLVAGPSRALYWAFIRQTEESFARLLILIAGSTSLVLTSSGGLPLRVVKDAAGTAQLDLAPHSIWIANHQSYLDWVYAWCFAYFANTHSALCIILKKSLKWTPIAGVSLQLWKFIFLDNWTEDREPTGEALSKMGERAMKHNRKLTLLVYPEGTLVSRLTRPKSKKYAEKTGVDDLRNTLLPRSTGLLFSLRTLAATCPDLVLYDLTFGYPGLPAGGYAQTFYTLSSVLARYEAPPQIHIHLRAYKLSEIPLGPLAPGRLTPVERDEVLSAEDREKFDGWLRERWIEKDELLEGFYRDGEFPGEKDKNEQLELPLRLRGVGDYFAIGANLFLLYVIWKAGVWGWSKLW